LPTEENAPVALQQQKAGPLARLFCEESPEFQGFHRFFDLVVEQVLSKVRLMPA
jgi:hypothetical protein